MFFKRISSLILFLLIAGISGAPLSWKVFSNGKYTWIGSSSSVYVFSSDSRTVYPLELDQTRTVGTIADIISSDEFIIMSTDAA